MSDDVRLATLADLAGVVRLPADFHRRPDRAAIAAELATKARRAVESGDPRAERLKATLPGMFADSSPPRPAIATRHLAYHVYPSRTNDLWRENVARLLRGWSLFNGALRVAVAEDSGSLGLDDVRREFGRAASGVEWWRFVNDPELRETVSFLPLLVAASKSARDDEATFYAHTKGNTTGANAEGAWLWARLMYRLLLAPEALDALGDSDAVGVHKTYWPRGVPWPSGLRRSTWFLGGTFFWFRHSAVFARHNWRDVAADRYGAESWIGQVLPMDRARSLFQCWPERQSPVGIDHYSPALYPAWVRDA